MISFKKLDSRSIAFLIGAICISFSFLASVNYSYAESLDNKPLVANKSMIIADSHEEISRLTADHNQMKEQVNHLNELVQSQDKTIKNISEQLAHLRNSESSGFEVWTGILLACVSLIVTGLGVIFAVFSIVGYKQFKDSAIEAATKIAKEITPAATEKMFKEHVENGGFNEVIISAVDKIALSNIKDPEQENV